MIGIIFVIICAVLIVEEFEGESLGMTSTAWHDDVFLSTEHGAPGTKHFMLICTKQKFGAQACTGEPVGRPSLKNFRLAPLNGSYQFLDTITRIWTFSYQFLDAIAIFWTGKTSKKTTGVAQNLDTITIIWTQTVHYLDTIASFWTRQ